MLESWIRPCWLTSLHLAAHSFALHKGALHDALYLRYGWTPPTLPSSCACGASFTVEHSLHCPTGGFPAIRHNELRDTTAHLLTEVCSDVLVEPPLQNLSGEHLSNATANRQDQARADIAARGFWGRHQRAFFDVRIFNPFARSYLNSSLSSCHKNNENEKRRAYDQRIREVEHGSFSPLIFSTAGGMSPTTTVVYKRLASAISGKNGQSYSHVLHWIRCRIGFSLLSVYNVLAGSQVHSSPPY